MDLKQFMERYDMNADVLAVKAGLSSSCIWKYLKGRKPQQSSAEKIEKFTGGLVTVKELRGKDDREKRRGKRATPSERCEGNIKRNTIRNPSSDNQRPFTFEDAKRKILHKT